MIAENIIDFINSATKENLQALGVIDRPAIIVVANKVLYKHIYAHRVQNKVKLLHKKVKTSKTNSVRFSTKVSLLSRMKKEI